MKRSPLRHRSKRKQSEHRKYVAIAKEYLAENPYCHIKSPVCTFHSECVHHKKGRGIYLPKTEFFAASCILCNGYVEDHKQWAVDRGFRLGRIGIL